jgi:catechol 2,3-dioxygenase-like lactoylglutathione lyase family enzyme
VATVAFSHVALRVADLPRALGLYRDRLGFRPLSQLVISDTPSFRQAGLDDAEMVAWFGHRDCTAIELQVVTSRTGRAIPSQLNRLGFRHLAFRVRDVAATARSVEAAGGRVEWATHTHTHNDDVDGDAIFGTDPEGQLLEFLELAGGPDQPCGVPLTDLVTVSDGTVTDFDHVALGVADLDRAVRFYTSDAIAGTITARDADHADLAVFATRLRLERVTPTAPELGIRRLAFTGPEQVVLADPDGSEIVVSALGATPPRNDRGSV